MSTTTEDVSTEWQHFARMKFCLIPTLVLMFLVAGTANSNHNRQKRFILLKRLLQMNGNGDSALFRDPAPTAPSCPSIYIQQQAQTEATQPPYYTTTSAPYYTTTPAPYYTTTPAPYYTTPAPAYNPPPTYDYTTPGPAYTQPPPPAYSKPSYSPNQPRYEQLPTYLQMPPIYKPPTPSYIQEHQQHLSSYQSPLVPQHMF